VQGRVEAWKDRFGFYLDGMYVRLDGEGFETTTGPITIDADLELENALVDFGVGWRIASAALDPDTSEFPRLTIDLLGGARYQYLKAEISRTFLPTLSDSSDWVEPMIGGRVKLQIDERLSSALRGDASGFGIGSASDLTWILAAGVDIAFSETFGLRLADRVMGLDGSNGSGPNERAVDVTTHGPWLGLSFKFEVPHDGLENKRAARIGSATPAQIRVGGIHLQPVRWMTVALGLRSQPPRLRPPSDLTPRNRSTAERCRLRRGPWTEVNHEQEAA
jgi:hypothetical protein